MIRLPEVFEPGLQHLADLHVSNITDEVKKAVREYLERNNLWPPSKAE